MRCSVVSLLFHNVAHCPELVVFLDQTELFCCIQAVFLPAKYGVCVSSLSLLVCVTCRGRDRESVHNWIKNKRKIFALWRRQEASWFLILERAQVFDLQLGSTENILALFWPSFHTKQTSFTVKNYY